MKTPPADLLNAAKAAIQHSYSPYSHFAVAASVRAKDGKIFSGCNVENASYSVTTCAEEGAIAAMIASGSRDIVEVVVLVADDQLCPPCGACRQRLLEHASPDAVVHMCTLAGLSEAMTMNTLLPFSFGPQNLGK